MRPFRDRQNRSFLFRARTKSTGKTVARRRRHLARRKKKQKKEKKRALSRRVCAGGVTHLAVRSARRSGEIRNLSGSERRGCGEHFLFACRVCSFSNGFRLDPERDFIANSLTQGPCFFRFFRDQTSSLLFSPLRPFCVCVHYYITFILFCKREKRRERKRIIHRHHHGDGRGE